MQTTNILQVRKANRNRILNHIYSAKQISKQEISSSLKLSMPTVIQNLKELQEQNLIEYTGKFDSTGGRRPDIISFIHGSYISIGIEISKNHIKIIAIDLYVNVIHSVNTKITFVTDDKYYKSLGDIFETFIMHSSLEKKTLLGVGVSIPGVISEINGQTIIQYSPTLGLKNVVAKNITQYINFECIFKNDAKSSGFAEFFHTKDMNSIIYIMLKKGVGSAILIENRPFYGPNNRGGEIGHMTIIPNGNSCSCGKKGCFEAYVNPERLTETFNCDLATFFEQLSAGSLKHLEIWGNYIYHLTIGINNLRMILDCDVVIGGDVSQFLDKYMDEIVAKLNELNPFSEESSYIKTCRYMSGASAIGVALHHVDYFLSSI
jgi:predicted NBD/HSP70 family sugar kinase